MTGSMTGSGSSASSTGSGSVTGSSSASGSSATGSSASGSGSSSGGIGGAIASKTSGLGKHDTRRAPLCDSRTVLTDFRSGKCIERSGRCGFKRDRRFVRGGDCHSGSSRCCWSRDRSSALDGERGIESYVWWQEAVRKKATGTEASTLPFLRL